MQLDSYTPCPCGSGKKIKFCCSKDLLHELEKILRAISGEQYASAVTQITKLIADRGARPALLSLLAEAHLALQNLDECLKIANQLLEVMPHSSAGLGFLAIADVLQDKVDDAVKHLQQSLENIEDLLPTSTNAAVSILARALLDRGKYLAARGHLLLLAGLSGGKDPDAVRSLVNVNRLPQLPTLLKEDFHFAECPPGVPWKGEFDAAMKTARRGAWLAACESLESLSQKVPGQPAVIRTIATLRSWLGQDQPACAAWRAYSLLPDVPRDEAVEAEAVCQLLLGPEFVEMTHLLRITYPVRNTDQLLETLLSDKRIEVNPADLKEFAEEGQPPPRGVFRLLDRPMPTSHEGLTLADLPHGLGDLLVFGKQTDREARLEFEIERSERLEESRARLLEVAGEWLEAAPTESVQGQVSALQFRLNPDIRFPRDITLERAEELNNANRHFITTKVFPDLPRKVFDGKSAREAVQDPNLRIRVEAALLNLQLATEQELLEEGFDFNIVRQDLGLPTRGTYRLDGQLFRVPVSRMARLELRDLPDNVLSDLFRLANLKNIRLAIRRSAQELVSRPGIGEKIELEEVYRILVTVSADSTEALQTIDAGRRFSINKGDSPAVWYLLELELRLARAEADECNRLTRLLSSRHANEPGVREALYRVLVNYGVISPDGKVITDRPEPAAAGETPTLAGETSILTPDAPPKKETKIWLPGMP